MIELDYKRWGFLKSKLVYFAEHSPSTHGYHFVICRNGYSALADFPYSKKYEKPTLIINLNQGLDNIFSQIHKKRRNIIRQGIAIGFDLIISEPTNANLKEFQSLYNQTIVQKGATPILHLNYFRSIALFLTILKISYKGSALDILILLHDGQTVQSHYLAHSLNTSNDKVRYLAGSYIYWEAIKHFQQLGYKKFDFGGLEPHHMSPPQGYTAFKLSFGGQIVPVYNYEAALTPAARVFSKVAQQMERTIRKVAHGKIRS